MLFTLASFVAKAGGERVYIRTVCQGAVPCTVTIWEKGQTRKEKVESITKAEESITTFANILEGYFNKGFKLVGTSSIYSGYGTEYILEKE